MRAVWRAVLVVGCAGALAGCVDAGVLVVGSHHFGQHLAWASESTGHTLDVVIDEGSDIGLSPRVVPLLTRRGSESWLDGPVQGADAFSKRMELVLRRTRSWEGDEAPSQAPPKDVLPTAISVGTARPVFTDLVQGLTYSVNGATKSWERSTRTFHRHAEVNPIDYGSLAGRALRVGERIEFSREHASPHVIVRDYVNYTVLREGELDGKRVFVLSSESGSEVVSIAKGVQMISFYDPVSPGERVPERVRLHWVSEGAPVPLKSVFHSPFKFAGAWYWNNATSRLVAHEAAGGRILWGSGDPPAQERATTSKRWPASQYLAKTESTSLTYPVSSAWAAVNGDPALVDFVRFRAEQPDAWPTGAYYVPDARNGTYTWTFGVQGSRGFPIVVSSRLSFALPPPAPPLVRNRVEDSLSVWPSWPPRQWEAAVPTPLVPLEDALAAYCEVRMEASEPGVVFGPVSERFGSPKGAQVRFMPSEDLRKGNERGLDFLVPSWSVSVDAVDGGLRAFNWTFVSALPPRAWFPPVPGPDDTLGAVGVPAIHLGPDRILVPRPTTGQQ